MSVDTNYSPGSLIRARGREWMVINVLNKDTLRIRPLTGSEEDQTLIHLPLEREPVQSAKFPAPKEDQISSHEGAVLLRDALLLSLRRGAGPFRSFGQIAVEPRAYQLVPLLMALKLETIRLLIADDVGIGKTIEAALIARELIDRGEIDRFTVLCPPHLVDQWKVELENRFHLRAEAVTASSASRLEKNLPVGVSIFTAHPYTVVSLDYIKANNRRSEFLRACPEFVIIDEAHTCTMGAKGRHQRYELLKGLAERSDRHMLFLTATPHSGDEEAFYKLLGLLRPEFQTIREAAEGNRKQLREKLAEHFVQRRRPDITEWKDGSLFPKRETAELTYSLSGKWEKFLENVLDYCAEIVKSAGSDEKRQRLNFWGTLALLRCVSSSPAAAIQALHTRALNSISEEGEEILEDQVFDGDTDHLIENDQELGLPEESANIRPLIEEAKALLGQKGDPKLDLLQKHLSGLIKDGFNPVIFCRYIATAKYVRDHVSKMFPSLMVDVITGELSSDERKEKVEDMGQSDSQRILVATDCLSEGINLQTAFDAVVHYDLSWNPTRHEQREGRVDRYGQPKKVVRATLIYGENNPVDGAVLKVILRKAESIRKELGVPVPLPDDSHKLTQALMKTVLLSHAKRVQPEFDFNTLVESKQIETVWKDAAEKAKRNTTVFAQNSLKPEKVLPEWQKSLSSIGSSEDVKRFTLRALARIGTAPEKYGSGYRAPLSGLPSYVRERLEHEGLEGTPLIDFSEIPSSRYKRIARSHPLVHVLADSLLEKSLSKRDAQNSSAEPMDLGRVGVWTSSAVKSKTTVLLLRLRHKLSTQARGKSHTQLVEEASCIAWEGKDSTKLIEGVESLKLLENLPDSQPPKSLIERNSGEALSSALRLERELNAYAEKRAKDLLSDHERVREAAKGKVKSVGKYEVTALLPPDIIGIYVLLPKVD